MGGCESCASGRRKEAHCSLRDAAGKGNVDELHKAIKQAEADGVDTLAARKHFSELARQERQSAERVSEMLRWGMATQDGIILYSVISEASGLDPEHDDLPTAKVRLRELQDDTRIRLLRLSRQRDARGLDVALDRARKMGIPTEELARTEATLARIEQGGGKDVSNDRRYSNGIAVSKH